MDDAIEGYAQMIAELAAAGDARAGVLARHGLDDASWDVIDTRWQTLLSEAMDHDPEDDGVPASLSAHAAAYEAAQRAITPPISLEQFASVTRLLDASGDLRASLSKVGLSLADYVRGSEHWAGRLAGCRRPDRSAAFGRVLAPDDERLPVEATPA